VKKLTMIFTVSAMVLTSVQVFAMTTIDFEGTPDTYHYKAGYENLDGYYSGLDFSNVSQTVFIFDWSLGHGYYGPGDFIPHSGTAVVGASHSIQVDFLGFTTSYVEGWYTTSCFDIDGFSLKAYDASDNLLDSSFASANIGTNSMISVSSAGNNIAYVVFNQVSGDLFTMDDFAYESNTGAVIPVPGAVFLGGIGAALVGWLRRRRAL
jgi:hypothetical protein